MDIDDNWKCHDQGVGDPIHNDSEIDDEVEEQPFKRTADNFHVTEGHPKI